MMEVQDYRSLSGIKEVLDCLTTDRRLKVDMSLMDELSNYMDYNKSLRDISASRYRTREDLHGLAAPFENVQYMRGRVLRIKTGHLPIQRILKRLWAACVTRLSSMPEVSKLSPVARKDAFFMMVLDPLKERMDECEMVIETATEVEKHLANAHFTLKELRGINEAFLEEALRDRNR